MNAGEPLISKEKFAEIFIETIAEYGTENVWLILEGDWGGSVFLTIPWKLIGPKANLNKLLQELDQKVWGSSNEGEGGSIYMASPEENRQFDEKFGEKTNHFHIAGGMGGGEMLPNAIWILEEAKSCLCKAKELLDYQG